MRTTSLLLVAAVFVVQTSSAPSCDGGSSIEATKSTKSSNANSATCDESASEIRAQDANGAYSEKSSKSSSSTASSSSSESVETYKAYTGGAPPCDDYLPLRRPGECDVTYYRRIFTVNECDKESVNHFYARVFRQYRGECDADYVKRIRFIFSDCYKSLDCRNNDDYLCYLEKYYVITYKRFPGETEREFFKRTITKTTETEEEYNDKIVIMKRWCKNLDWSRVKIDYCSKAGYIYLDTISTSTGRSLGLHSSSTEVEIRKEYDRRTDEVDLVYYKRIVSYNCDNDVEYEKFVSILRKIYCALPIWYDPKYYDIVYRYYSIKYKRITGEDDDTYFKRIFFKESYETDEQLVRRVDILRYMFPDLDIWYNDKYYDLYLKNFYSFIFRKCKGEDDFTYYKRIVVRIHKETDDCYVRRINLLMRHFHSYDMWYDLKYYTLVKEYYTIKYTRLSSETIDTYYKRICTKEVYETDDQMAWRVYILSQILWQQDLWYNDKYYDLYTKTIYGIVFKRRIHEDEITYYKRIIFRIGSETDDCYVRRMNLIVRSCHNLPIWYSEKYYYIVKDYYVVKYGRRHNECDGDYYKRLTIREVCDCEDDHIYAQRIYLVHRSTVSCSFWYDVKFYEYTKTYYSVFYRKGDSESCVAWLTRVITLIPGECEDLAIKRLILINRSKCGCSCWTADNIKKIECSFRNEYIVKIRKAFIRTSSVEIKKSSKSSSCQSADSSESSSVVSIQN